MNFILFTCLILNFINQPFKDSFHFIVFEENKYKLNKSSVNYLNNKIRNISDTIYTNYNHNATMVLIAHTCPKELAKNPKIGILRQKYLADYLVKNSIVKFKILIDPIDNQIYPFNNCHKSGIECTFITN